MQNVFMQFFSKIKNLLSLFFTKTQNVLDSFGGKHAYISAAQQLLEIIHKIITKSGILYPLLVIIYYF